MSIFSRCQPCDVGVEHDDHTCYSCEQRLLHPESVPGAMKISTPEGGVEIPGLRLSDASRMRFISVDCQTATGITWDFVAMAYWNIDFCCWSEDDYSGHCWLEKKC